MPTTRLALLLLATLAAPGAYAQSAQATTDATIEAQAKIDDAIPSTWSLNAGAGLTAVNYSRQTPESATLSDVIFWSDTKGLFGGAAVGANKVSRDVAANQIYYNNHDVTAQQILSGAATNPKAQRLVDVLP